MAAEAARAAEDDLSDFLIFRSLVIFINKNICIYMNFALCVGFLSSP
jgi:hypothetical protein